MAETTQVVTSALASSGIKAPQFNALFAISIAVWILIIILAAGIAGITAYFMLQRKNYNQKIIIKGKVNGVVMVINRDIAMKKRFGRAGAYILHFKKLNLIKPMPQIASGFNEWTYFNRSDGELINIGTEDIDLKMREEKIKYIHPDMRYASEEIASGLKSKYDDESWLKKNAAVLMLIGVILIGGIILLLFMGKSIEMGNAGTAALKEVTASATEMAKLSDSMSKLMDRIEMVKANSGIISKT